MNIYYSKLICVILLVILLGNNYQVNCYGQKAETALSTIPIEFREQLHKRLTLLINYQKHSQWEEMYDILKKQHNKETSKQTFIKNMQNVSNPQAFVFLDFEITNIEMIEISANNNLWELYGCGTFSVNGDIKKFKAHTYAELYNKDWFFSEMISPLFTSIDGSEIPCTN